MEARLQRAVVARDLDELDRIIADDAFFTGPDGTTIERGEDLEAHRSGKLRVLEFDARQVDVRMAGPDAAEVVVVARLRLKWAGAPHEGVYRYARTYALRSGEWQMIFARADAAHVD